MDERVKLARLRHYASESMKIGNIMKKDKLQKLLDTMVFSHDIKVTGDGKIAAKFGDKVFEREVKEDSEISQAIQEIQNEANNYTFMNSFKPSEEASNKVDGKEGMKQDANNRK